MDERSLRVLEYPKILEQLAEFTSSDYTRKIAEQVRPSEGFEEAKRLLAETDEAVRMLLKRGDSVSLGEKNILPAVGRAKMDGVLNLGELLGIADVLKVSRYLKNFIEGDGEERGFPILTEMASGLFPNRILEEDIFSAILSPEEMADGASPKLYDVRRKMARLHDKIRQMLDDMIRSPRYQKYLQDSIVTMRSDRYVIPVKAESRGEVAGVVHDTSSSGATVFVEPIGVVNANNEIRALMVEEEKEIERILAEFSVRVAECADTLISNFHTIAAVDIIFARARLALRHGATMPQLNENGVVNLKNARHPLLKRETAVANHIYLGSNFTTLVITGPNTGGKTVTLKTIGLLSLMAASGMFIPASDGSDVAFFDSVFADIGDEQSIEQSLSTFSSHMVNIVHILSGITPSSLVLFDELGAGTDPTEGAALAVSILEFVKSMGTRVAATTHYSELKLYALSTQGVENASCEFDVASLKPTYKLLIGIPGKSNAFAISQKLGLPEFIISRAKGIISEENVKFEDVITDLEANRLLVEREKERVEALRRDAEAYKQQIEEQNNRLRENKTKYMEKARQDANRIVEQARSEANALIKELQALRAQTANEEFNKKLEESRSKLKKQEDKIARATNLPKPQRPAHTIPKNLMPGELVEVLSLGKTASVLKQPDSKGDVFLQVGIMKITANVKDLKRVSEKAYEAERKGTPGSRAAHNFSAKAVRNEIDVRGMTVEEAILDIDKFLDDAALAGLTEVSVIHGKGTGALRAGVQDYLRRNKHAKSFRLGRYGEGETGVTIVELR